MVPLSQDRKLASVDGRTGEPAKLKSVIVIPEKIEDDASGRHIHCVVQQRGMTFHKNGHW
jgi:hypothetical protein